MTVRVSVVVAVHDPGPGFDDLVASLLRQTLPATDFEVWFCDDGSAPASLARLEALTSGHAHFAVLRLPHSGWPGAPRNAGLDAATGTYVFFADDDDRLGDDALRTMVDQADAWGSDVLVPRLTRVARRLTMGMFRRDVPDARLGVDPLLALLTPHKLFRTAMLREHDIRFPSGRVRLEDHLFVLQAYFAASRISILAGYACYYWVVRPDRPSISVGRPDPVAYFADLERVLDLVEAHTAPGPLRDRLLVHWYEGKVLDLVGATKLTRHPADYRTALLDVLEPLVARRFPERLDALLPYPKRLRSALLRSRRRDDLVRVAEVERLLSCQAEATALRWSTDGCLEVDVTVRVRLRDGSPVPVEPDEHGRLRWRPPVAIRLAEAGAPDRTDELVVLVRDRTDETDYWSPDDAPVTRDGPFELRSSARIDVRTAQAGRPLARRAELGAHVLASGWRFAVRLEVSEAVIAGVGSTARPGGRLLTPGRGQHGQLLLTTTRPAPALPGPPAPARRGLTERLRRGARSVLRATGRTGG